jgi:hypothetical protein
MNHMEAAVEDSCTIFMHESSASGLFYCIDSEIRIPILIISSYGNRSM